MWYEQFFGVNAPTVLVLNTLLVTFIRKESDMSALSHPHWIILGKRWSEVKRSHWPYYGMKTWEIAQLLNFVTSGFSLDKHLTVAGGDVAQNSLCTCGYLSCMCCLSLRHCK